jgi:hypothetical protein
VGFLDSDVIAMVRLKAGDATVGDVTAIVDLMREGTANLVIVVIVYSLIFAY